MVFHKYFREEKIYHFELKKIKMIKKGMRGGGMQVNAEEKKQLKLEIATREMPSVLEKEMMEEFAEKIHQDEDVQKLRNVALVRLVSTG